MTHRAIYTIPFTLQLCYKPLGILQRLTKNQKVHISDHDGLEKLHCINFGIGHRISQRGSRVAGLSPFPNQVFWEQYTYCSSSNRSIILWLPSIHHINICRETWFPMIEVMEEVNQPQNWLRNIIFSFTYG